ncbi:hypothetical protein I4U23_004159 [Adineta vaga]|nr:hypothetical protein I4U23_004159 [Adineta vaga]
MDYYTELASKHDGDISILVLLQSSKHLEHSVEGAFNPRISSNGTFPICVISKWNLTSDDSIFMNATQSIADTLLKTMIADGQYNNATEQIIYPNFALETTPVSLIYGKNLPRLQNIRKTWDPENVMYLTGGWKI